MESHDFNSTRKVKSSALVFKTVPPSSAQFPQWDADSQSKPSLAQLLYSRCCYIVASCSLHLTILCKCWTARFGGKILPWTNMFIYVILALFSVVWVVLFLRVLWSNPELGATCSAAHLPFHPYICWLIASQLSESTTLSLFTNPGLRSQTFNLFSFFTKHF